MSTAALILDDGFSLVGTSFGARAPLLAEISQELQAAGDGVPRAVGEVVFVTAMSGYHELLTDPSYTGQIVTMTYPHFGNYGCDDRWSEATAGARGTEVSPSAVVTRTVYTGPVAPGRERVSDYLTRHGVPGITNVDTRRLTLHLRDRGVRNGLIIRCDESLSNSDLHGALDLLESFPKMEGRDLVSVVGTASPTRENPGGSPHIALLDCGAKRNIVRKLVESGCEVSILPSTTSADVILALDADALFVSNGPGDPGVLDAQVETIRGLLGRLPVLGICMGHQLIARALGGRTVKMRFGHHGINHPVRDLRTGNVFVTSQNHGFAVSPDSLPDGCEIWFENANDHTVEGLVDMERRVMTTQFHPESAPGPHDSHWIFDAFLKLVPNYGGGNRAGSN